MFRKNRKHLQPMLISSVNQLPEGQRQRLEQSWAGAFYREVFSRLDEEPFGVLYSNLPSRPNIPINVLVGLETLKAGFGWSDEELYDAFLYNVQVRYALGYQELGEGEFELRSLYYFRQRLSQYTQTTGINLLERAFEQVTDEQIAAFELKTGKQRMDSTQIASNIRQQRRVQLLVEILLRVQRMLSEADQQRYAEEFAPYLKGNAGHYTYQLKKEDYPQHLERIGALMCRLVRELRSGYAQETIFQVLERVFGEHFRLDGEKVNTKANQELSGQCLQSPDDWEATIRECGHGMRQGYVANLTETCDGENSFQLITKVQVAPNSCDDSKLLEAALPNLVERTDLETLYTDGGFGSPQVDQLMIAQQITLLQSGIRGPKTGKKRLSYVDFHFTVDETGQPLQVTCPNQHTVPLALSSQKKGYLAQFPVSACENCPFHAAEHCPTRFRKRDPSYNLNLTLAKMRLALRRQGSQAVYQSKHNPRAAIEATVRAVKHPFPKGKLPVRGRFRIFSMMIGSALMNNVRHIQRFLKEKSMKENRDSFGSFCKNCFSAPSLLSLPFFCP